MKVILDTALLHQRPNLPQDGDERRNAVGVLRVPPLNTPLRPKSSGPLFRKSRTGIAAQRGRTSGGGGSTWEDHDVPRFLVSESEMPQSSSSDPMQQQQQQQQQQQRGRRRQQQQQQQQAAAAATAPNAEQRRWLLRRGFDGKDVNATIGHRLATPMHQAAREGDLSAAKWLVACGAVLAVKDVSAGGWYFPYPCITDWEALLLLVKVNLSSCRPIHHLCFKFI